jgi:hypothetical protein
MFFSFLYGEENEVGKMQLSFGGEVIKDELFSNGRFFPSLILFKAHF